MIFKILCAGIFLLLASIIFTVIYVSLMKAAKEDFKNEETESVFDSAEIKEVSLDDIPEDLEIVEGPLSGEITKVEQYEKDISEAFPEDVVEAVTKDKDDKLAEELVENKDFWEDVKAVTEEDIQKDFNTYYEEQGYKFLDILLPQTLQAFTQEQCFDYDVPYELVLALMESESSFRKDIGSEKVLGDIIETFNDGDIVTLHILESHTDVTPYTNYMYDIFGNASENIQYGNKDVVYKIMPGSYAYSCKVTKMENGISVSSKEFTSEDILQYKNSFSMLYPVYNMKFDWHGMDPSSGYPQMSFQAISDSNYIKYNGNTKTKGETIKTWQAIGFTGFEVTDDTNKNTAQSSTADAVPSIHLCKRIGGAQICVANKDKKTIFSDVFYDHKDVYYNGHYHKAMFLVYDNPGVADCWKKKIDGLALTYAGPYWFLMTTRAGIEYNGRTYEARKLIRSWPPSDSVNMTLRETISRSKPSINNNYDHIVYDIEQIEGIDSITVKEQRVDTVKDEEGYTHKEYTDLDTLTFSSFSSTPIRFHNIEFRLIGTTWTIYSKCGYIRYNGRMYYNNRSILSFSVSEAIHIEIADETNKYEIKEAITYVVKTPDSDITVGYSLHTSETALTMKIVKTSGDREEPWVTANFYEAIYQPFMYDDISLMFDTTEMKWELYSNNDNLYYNGTNYAKGDKLGEWPYRQIVRIGNIIVTHENHDAIQISKTSLANGKLIKNEDVDEDIAWHNSESVDFHISYSYAKGIWIIKAVHDCWCDGIRYTEGQIIKQFKTKVYIEPFSILCQYQDDPESQVYTNIVYSLNVNITPDGITSITIDSAGHNSVTYSDKDISHGQSVDLIVTKQDARSMYGYIWQKEETPPPPGPWPIGYICDFVLIQNPTDNRYATICGIIPNELYHRKLYLAQQNVGWLAARNLDYFYDSGNLFRMVFGVNDIYHDIYISTSPNYAQVNQRNQKATFPDTSLTFSVVGIFTSKTESTVIYYYDELTENNVRYAIFLVRETSDIRNGNYTVGNQYKFDNFIHPYDIGLREYDCNSSYYAPNGNGWNWHELKTNGMMLNTLTKAIYLGCPGTTGGQTTFLLSQLNALTYRYLNGILDVIYIPNNILTTIRNSVQNAQTAIVHTFTKYFNNTFYVLIYAGDNLNFNGQSLTRTPPEQWDQRVFHNPSCFLLTYNDIAGFNLYDQSNSDFYTTDRSSNVYVYGGVYYALEKWYSNPFFSFIYQESDLYLMDNRYDRMEESMFGDLPQSKICLYKLNETTHTFAKLKDFKNNETTKIYDIIEKDYEEIINYNLVRRSSLSANIQILPFVQNIGRELRRKDLINGLYLYKNETTNYTQKIYYFSNPLFDEDDFNFCFDATEYGFSKSYSEDGTW